MTNLDPQPTETPCSAGAIHAGVELVEPRDVPLGGPRAMTVRRTLPSRGRSMVGAFCFIDHYGPDDVAATGGMDVAPHPHIGLQTVTWLFEGRVRHRDALGSLEEITPGQLNLMTSGAGICHSEEATPQLFPESPRLHGVQLWTALPEEARHGERAFEHVEEVPSFTLMHADDRGAPANAPADAVGEAVGRVQVVMGSLGGVTSPARAYTPLVAAQIDLAAGAVVRLEVEESFEHAVLVDLGDLALEGTTIAPAWVGYVAPGRRVLELRAGDGPVRAMLVGGEPFDEQILMWWNFVGRTHDEVVEARRLWQDAVDGGAEGEARFGKVVGYDGRPLPAPELPHVRLRPRAR
ncbi:pirin family protein [Sanguibacter sp. A247]|uniref:pirin family protein n=1 Tax=unclassified Sanguibacter TaxID=2645534 RepID=UPI003FD6FE6E